MNDRTKWLAQRRELITASDVPAILGMAPPRSAWSVYVQKKTGSELDDTDEMMMGRMFEEPIAQLYAIKTGRPVVNLGSTEIQIHPDIPWLGATLDRSTWEVDDDPIEVDGSPLEIKHGGSYQLKHWDEGAPVKVQIQLQLQIACTCASWGAYCGVIGGNAPIFGDMYRNDTFLDSTYERLELFKWMLDNEIPPPVTSPLDLGPIKKLYPLDSGETVQLDKAHLKIANRWEQSKADIKSSEDEKETTEAKLRAYMGDATFGILLDGTMLTLWTTKRKDGAVYRTLRRKVI